MFKVDYIASGVGTEYQIITARKPLIFNDCRDPEVVSRWLESKIMFDYVLEKSMEEGKSTVEVQREIEAEKIDEKLGLSGPKKQDALPSPETEQAPKLE